MPQALANLHFHPARLPLVSFLAAMPAINVAFGISIAIHAVLLSIHFELPDKLAKASERALDVILVNSKQKSRPTKAQAKAQTNLDGGGNVAEDRRAKTPLPASQRDTPGDAAVEARRRVAELEAQQQAMLTQMKAAKSVNAERASEATPTPAPAISGADLASSALAIARLEGQIARNLEEYQQRPRKRSFGARVEEYRFAQYIEDWRQKVERIGNLNYPEAARGKLYGSLVLTVVIKASGDLDRVELNRSSGQKLLDDAALRIVKMAAPYPAFPKAISRDTDILEISRTWTFTSADRLSAE